MAKKRGELAKLKGIKSASKGRASVYKKSLFSSISDPIPVCAFRPYFGVLPGQFRPFLPLLMSLFFAGVSFPVKNIFRRPTHPLSPSITEKHLPRAHDVSVHAQ
jgi:hypothetical protein